MIIQLKQYPILSPLLMMLAAIEPAIAYDSGSKALGNEVGATDYYQVSCPAGTDHVSFKILDQSDVVQPAPQLLNAHLKKPGFTQVDASAIKAGEQSVLALAGGKGKYTLIVDSQNTNLELKKAQSFKYESECVYMDGTSKKTVSGKKTLKNGTATKASSTAFAINCAAKKKTTTTEAVDVDKLIVTFIDTTAPTSASSSAQLLSAQITKRDQAPSTGTTVFAANATDINGDSNYGAEIRVDRGTGGNNDFFLTINQNGTNAALDNSKLYNFNFNCLDSGNTEVAVPTIVQLQDK